MKALVAILLMQSAWMTALPTFRGPDEIEHLLRSSSVSLGHWSPATQPTQDDPLSVTVQEGIARAIGPTCRELRKDLNPEVCRPERVNGNGTVEMRSGAALYNPLYYAIAGLPLRVLDGTAGSWGVRVAGAVLSALLIAWAWVLIAVDRTSGWPATGFLLALTPAIGFATTVAAPNGIHYAAGLLLWAGLLSARRNPARRGVVPAMAVGACVMISTHTTGIVWLFTIGLSALVLIGPTGFRHIFASSPKTCAFSAVLTLVSLAGVLSWILFFTPNLPSTDEPFSEETRSIPMAAHGVLWIFQTIGVMPNRFDLLWTVIYGLWLAPLAVIFTLAVRSAAARERAAWLVMVTLGFSVPVAVTVATYDIMGVGWQGRYQLPLLVGIIMLAGEALDGARNMSLWSYRSLAVLIAAATYLSIVCLGQREAVGPHDDGRPWTILLYAVAPLVIAAGYSLLTGAGEPAQSRPSEKADSRSWRENV